MPGAAAPAPRWLLPHAGGAWRKSITTRRRHDDAVETTAIITDEGTLTVQVPPDITSGDYHIVVIIDEQPTVQAPRPPLQFVAYPVGLSAPEQTFRRAVWEDDAREPGR